MGDFGSINYSRTVFQLKHYRFNISLGYEKLVEINGTGLAQGNTGNTYIDLLPISIGIVTGAKNNHFEINAGIAPYLNSKYVNYPGYNWPIANIGYRYQKPENGFIFRIFLGSEGLGVGFGYGF